jgi:hypothetical protein
MSRLHIIIWTLLLATSIASANEEREKVQFLLGPSTPENVNDAVTFEVIKGSLQVTPDGACPSGFAAVVSFDARLRNVGDRTLTDLVVEVNTLSNGNLLLNAIAGANAEGALWMVPLEGDYSEGELVPGSSVVVPFLICSKEQQRFTLVVDVLVVPGCKTPIKKLGVAATMGLGTCDPDPCGPCRNTASQRAILLSRGVCQAFTKPSGKRCKATGAVFTPRQGFLCDTVGASFFCTCESQIQVDCDP